MQPAIRVGEHFNADALKWLRIGISLVARNGIGLAFHVLVLIMTFTGFQAARQMRLTHLTSLAECNATSGAVRGKDKDSRQPDS